MPKLPISEDGDVTQIVEDGENQDSGEDWIVPISSRREGRERVIALLYELDIKDAEPEQLLNASPLSLDPFILIRFSGICEHKQLLDRELSVLSKDWEIARMPLLDKTILQLGLFELLFCPEVPTGVILSEAVELAQSLSTENSGKFVNGILSAAAKKLR